MPWFALVALGALVDETLAPGLKDAHSVGLGTCVLTITNGQARRRYITDRVDNRSRWKPLDFFNCNLKRKQ
jgi:hypothetical protein